MANQSIPASALVNVTPGVVGTGGNPLSLNGVFVTKNAAVPVGQTISFYSAADVSSFFGATSNEYAMALVYFNGFTNSNTKPGELIFTSYTNAPVSAWVRGGSLASVTLAQLKTVAPGVVTGSIAATTMTATAVTSGAIRAGQLLTGTGVTAGTTVVKQLSGAAGGTGTYQVSISQTVASTAITGSFPLSVDVDGVTATAASVDLSAATSFSDAAALLTTQLGEAVSYDSQRAGFQITSGTAGVTSTITYGSGQGAVALRLTEATGAIISQGAVASTPGTCMDAVAAYTQNWATFMTLWEPDIDGKMAFADWVNAQNQRYVYVCWDTDASATVSGNTTCFGAQVTAAEYIGICPVYHQEEVAAFVCGTTASIDFDETNGRITYAYKGQSGIVASVTNETIANNLINNGYNFYGAYATANDRFTFLQPGSTPGIWLWLDSYVNSIYLRNQLQLALLSLLASVKSLPYNNDGYTMVRLACQDPINQALNFGSIRAGVPLSESQKAQVNNLFGVQVDNTLATVGYYLQILPASSQVRGNRESPPITLAFMDGGSIQHIDMAAITVL